MIKSRKYLVVAILLLVLAPVHADTDGKPYEFHGIYLEGCTCGLACSCDLEGALKDGCQTIGAMIISSGSYADSDLAGVKIAFAFGHKWARVYIDAKDPAQEQAVEQWARAYLGNYGTVESVQKAKIELSGNDGNYTLKVNGGKIIDLRTAPVLGADQKTAVTYTNYPDPLFDTIMQAKTINGTFNDGKHHFTIKDTNSFFNPNWSTSGKM